MIDHITLSPSSLSNLCPKCKAMLAGMLGLSQEHTASEPIGQNEEEEERYEYAELGLQAARAFLLGCNAKTQRALQLIIEAGDTFSIQEIERQMEVERGSLRALWGGLTKRTRTITGDPDAALIEWGEQTDTGDYVGHLTSVSYSSFKRALTE